MDKEKKFVAIILVLIAIVGLFFWYSSGDELSLEEQAELEAELSQLSDEELDAVITEAEAEDNKAIAGQAYSSFSVGKSSVKPATVLKVASNIKLERIQESEWLRDSLTKSYLEECRCTTPSHVNIECQDDDWNERVSFDYFSQTDGIKSSENRDGAFCYYSKNMVPETKSLACDSTSDGDCDSFCESQLSQSEIAEIEDNLNDCVDYFTSQCDSEITITGAYGDRGSSIEDWWTVYGICGESTEE